MSPTIDPDRLGGQRRDLAAALRNLRRARGMSGKALAGRIHMSQSAISRIETGRAVPSADDVERILHGLDADEQARADILALARIARTSYTSIRQLAIAGLHRRQDDLAALVASCEHVRMFLPAIPTGLLQVAGYARAVITPTVKGRPARDVEKMLAARLARQQVLHDPTRRFGFLLTESAVRWRRAPLPVMAEQCAHMADVAQLPNIDLSVLPLAASVPVTPLCVFVLYDQRMVTCELPSGTVTLRDPADLDYYSNIYDALLERALRGEDAAAFLRATAADFAVQARNMRELE